ncbi:MAG: hypothetical protein KDD42_08550, partial [Bdellovibrionales bacterium]|nr:hypothetical protein [Bdellovibrionales bacterium]
MKKDKCRGRLGSELGAGVLMGAGSLLLLLVFVSLALHAVTYYSRRVHLQALAVQMALYGATFLPNPVLACKRTHQSFEQFKLNQISSGAGEGVAQIEYPQIDAEDVVVKISYIDTNGAEQLTTCASDGTFSPVNPYPPLAKLFVSLKGTYETSFLNLIGIDAAHWGNLEVEAEAAAQLEPTDVMLVIDNSNSVVSPVLSEGGVNSEPVTTGAFSNHPFTIFDEQFGRKDASGQTYFPASPGVNLASINKAVIHTRQCFGRIFYDLKRAALKTYDLLSASASFRVGVMFTNRSEGEYPTPDVSITSD